MEGLSRRHFVVALGSALLLSPPAQAQKAPSLMLAGKYHPGLDLGAYWVSEKYDGVRGYWDGQQLWTRGGERLQPPAWFTQGWPAQPMDGELWAGRGRFEHASGTVRQLKPDDLAWREIRFMVFDLPSHPGVFDARLQAYQTLVSQLNRSCLVKLKPFEDAEAKVLAHLLGQGKHSGRLGALVAETPAGLRFRLGGGFTDQQRESPPAVGRWITYRHHGQHSSGLPRFASFLRERPDFQPPEPGSAR